MPDYVSVLKDLAALCRLKVINRVQQSVICVCVCVCVCSQAPECWRMTNESPLSEIDGPTCSLLMEVLCESMPTCFLSGKKKRINHESGGKLD